MLACVHACLCPFVCFCMCVLCGCMCTCACMCMCMCAHVQVRVCVHVHVCACTCECVYVCGCVGKLMLCLIPQKYSYPRKCSFRTKTCKVATATNARPAKAVIDLTVLYIHSQALFLHTETCKAATATNARPAKAVIDFHSITHSLTGVIFAHKDLQGSDSYKCKA